MKQLGVALFALVAILTFTSTTAAQTIWDKGLPMTGQNNGQIIVGANINFGGGGLVTNGTVRVKTWVNGGNNGGGAALITVFLIKAGQGGAVDTGMLIVPGLTSGQTYNVYVEIQATQMGGTYYFTTNPATVKAK